MSDSNRKVIIKTKENNVVYTLKKMKMLEEENKNLNEQILRMNNNFDKMTIIMKEAKEVIKTLKTNLEEKEKNINEYMDAMFVYEMKSKKINN